MLLTDVTQPFLKWHIPAYESADSVHRCGDSGLSGERKTQNVGSRKVKTPHGGAFKVVGLHGLEPWTKGL